MSPDQAAHWLAGVFDGEGCVAATYRSRHAVITNTDPEIIDQCEKCLDILGIAYRTAEKKKEKPHHLRCWVIQITGRQSLKKMSRLPLASAAKRDKFSLLMSLYTTSEDDGRCQPRRQEIAL